LLLCAIFLNFKIFIEMSTTTNPAETQKKKKKVKVTVYLWRGNSIITGNSSPTDREIDAEEGINRLGSFDPNSVALLAYLLLNSSLEVVVKHTNDLDMSPTGMYTQLIIIIY
jgi:hypothetical protein